MKLSDSNNNNEEYTEKACLVITSGPHTGARLNLLEGHRYSIGSCVSSDIVVFDENVLASHLFLEMQDGEVSVVSGDGEVGVNGSVLKQNFSHVCTPHCSVEFGSTSFYIALSSQIKVPPTKDNVVNIPISASITNDVTPTDLSMFKKSILGIGALLLMIVGVVVGTTYSPALVANTEHQLVEEVELAMKPLGLESLSASVLPGGKILIDGYIAQDHQLTALSAAMERFDSRLEWNVVSDERLLGRANDLLSRFSSSSNVRAIKSVEGSMIFSGSVPDEASWLHVIANLKRDLSDIKIVNDDDVLTLVELKNITKAYMDERLPQVVLEYTIVDSSILIRGIVEESTQYEISEIADQLREKHGNRLKLIIQLAAVSPETEEIQVVSVVIGPISYFVTDSGDKYLTGARLSSGHVVMSIEYDRVSLLKNGKKSIHLTGSS